MSRKMKEVFGQLCLRKRLIALFLCLMLTLCFSACGKNETDDESDESEMQNHPSLIYVPEDLKFEDDADYLLSNVQFVGDKLYYRANLPVEDEETGAVMYDAVLRCHSLVQNTVTEVSMSGGEWSIGEDGSLYTVVTEWNGSENGRSGHIDRFLVHRDVSGEELFRQDITELFSGDEYIRLRIAIDAKGRSYLLTETGMYLFDESGNPRGTVKTEPEVNDIYFCSFSRSSDGKVFLSDGNTTGGRTTLYEVDFEAGKLGAEYSDFPSVGRNPSCDADGNMLTFDNTAVYRYNLKDQKKETVFEWSDSGIDVSFVTAVGALSNGSIAVVYHDWESMDGGVVLMTGVSADEMPQVEKKDIVIGCVSLDQGLQSAVAKFNKSSDSYHISVKNYGDGTDEEDALTRLQADIVSGNGPDILHLSGMWQTWPELAEKGAFEDLMPYLEQGSVLNREELLEGVINAYTYDGKLVAIPSVFTLSTYFGKPAVVGEEMGWTIDDVIALTEAHPEAELGDRIGFCSNIGIMRFCLQYSMDSFIDWERGTCDFDGDKFKELLEFANRFDDFEYAPDNSLPSERERVISGELLLCFASFYEFKLVQRYETLQGLMVAIGQPTPDGRPICHLSGSDPLAISSKSDVKEGAWAFIEYYVTTERSTGWTGFPSTRTLLDKMIEKEKEPMMQTTVGFSDGSSYTYQPPTQEEIDMIMNLIQFASIYNADNQQILEEIIIEEVEAYFSGQKSVDEVADIIQRRVGIYVSEHM